jgi:ABC-type multidrug transport system fused ATPase/permease subunit
VTPSAGAVSLGGAGQWRTAACQDLWQNVTLVAQETAMFNTSIRENLQFAQPDATDEQLLAAIGAMQLGELIARLPDGLDTVVGEHGYQMSGGERQRLALARALLAPGKILITDEATSALDNVTACAVHEALREHCRDRALVMIAHRLPQMFWDDQVVILAEGRITHRGTHGDLVRTCSEYRQLLAGQTAAAQAAGSQARGPKTIQINGTGRVADHDPAGGRTELGNRAGAS